MPAEQLDPLSPRLQSAVEELQGLIRRVDPTASFQVVPGDDPTGTYVIATVDVEDTETVIDAYIDRLLDLQIDEGLPVYVVPLRPLTRIPVH
jgi:H2-forming N5,N10-methylenetetrahydromethanopterin dehydrogenase-like enzyme